MARLDYVEPEDASPEVIAAYDLLGGDPVNAWKLLGHAPELIKPLHEFRDALYKSPSRTGERIRQLVSIRVSVLNQCHY